MANVRSSKAKGKSVKKKKRKKRSFGVVIPTEPEEPENDIDEHAILVHGEKKVGKTTIAMAGRKTLLLQHDPKQRSYRRYEILCRDWATSLGAIKKLERDLHGYDRICIDGADQWYHQCMKFVCAERGIRHPGDENWGGAWNAVRDEFTTALSRFLDLPCSCWLICHSHWKEVELRDGTTIDRLVPRLTSTSEELINGAVDGVFAYEFEGADGHRILRLQGDNRVMAGHRMDTANNPHFRCLRTGKPIRKLIMGNTPEEASEILELAFNNKYEVPIKQKKKKKKKKKGGFLKGS